MSKTVWVSSGRLVDLDNFSPDDVNPEDIARSLSNTCRFNGHCREFYSVAQHCILVSKIVPDSIHSAALLHDAAEAYLGDIIRPLKTIEDTAREGFVLDAIFTHFSLPPLTPSGKGILKVADSVLLAIEAELLLGVDVVRD